MKVAAALLSLGGIVVITPIWYFILYRLLSATNQTELVWFLFWTYVPLHFVVQITGSIIKQIED